MTKPTIAALSIAFLLLLAPAAHSATASNDPGFVCSGSCAQGDWFLNYDGEANYQRSTRDWPIDLVFYNDADVDTVKRAFAQFGYTRTGNPEHEAYNVYSRRQGPYRFDDDQGRKTECDSRGHDEHYRIYGPKADRFYSPAARWGYFVVASTHYDIGDGCPGDRRFGYSERVEGVVANFAENGLHWLVHEDYMGFGNKEPFHADTNSRSHVWESDGRATFIKVP